MPTLILRTNAAAVAAGIIEDDLTVSVPVIAVIAGKLNGEVLPFEELKKSLKAWEGVPVTFRHPVKANGLPDVIKNAPELIVGKLQNVKLKEKALHGFAVFKKNASPLVDSIIANIKAGAQYEVSTGYLAAMDGIDQTEVEPDHLAILPDEEGACSWSDGCGLPRNNSTRKDTKMNEEQVKQMIEEALAALNLDATSAAVEATQAAVTGLTETVEGLAQKMVENAATGEDGDDEDAPPADDDNEGAVNVPPEIQGILDAVNSMGGPEGITAALKAVKSNSDAQREALIEEIKANSQTFTDEDLASQSMDMLAKLAAQVRPASWDLGRFAAVHNAANDEWVDYESVTE